MTSSKSSSSLPSPSQPSRKRKATSTPELAPPSKKKTSLDKLADSFLPTPRTKSSKTSGQGSTSREKACVPYWTESTRAWSARLSSCTKTDCLALPRTSWNTSLSRLASNSWFTVRTKTLRGPASSPRTFSPSQPCLSQAITESEARKAAEQQAKSEARKKAQQDKKMQSGEEPMKDEARERKPSKTYENPIRARRIRVHPTPDQEKVMLSWFGTCRFVYNQGVEMTRDSTEKVNMATLRARTKSDEMLTEHPWLEETPEDVRSGALRDLIKARSAHFAKLRNMRKSDPSASLACKFKFRSKRDRQQSIEIRARDWNRTRGLYSKLFGQGVLKGAEELPKELEATCRLIRDRLGRYYICLVRQVAIRSENQAPKSTHGVVSLDPGVRTFQTCYDADGLVAEWGEADMTKLFQDCHAADRLQTRIKQTKGNSTKKHRRRLAWHRLLQRIRNKVNEVHKKLSTWLCENYRVVLIPKFETQNMVRRRHRKLSSKTARGMCTWAHYRFRQTLLSKAELYPWCKVVVCDEHYTSKTCGACGQINPTLGSKKTFDCVSCGYSADRDVSAARNILLRYLTREKIGFP